MELKWIFIFLSVAALSVSVNYAITSNAAISAGLEECPRFGAGTGAESIWVRSCTEYTKLIIDKKGK